MKLITTFIVCLCVFGNVLAQDVSVIDNDTQEPISGVTIYNRNKTKSVITNFDGIASLDQFDNSETLFFQKYTLCKIFRTKI